MKLPSYKRALISGASFAGLVSAYWLSDLGYDVTVVELSPVLRRGGTAVNLRGRTIGVVERMGLLPHLLEKRLNLLRWEIKNADDRSEHTLVLRSPGDPPPDDDFEIERDVLLTALFDAVKDRCRVAFGDSIASLRETEDAVEVTFRKSETAAFDLVLGCDGTHSNVRKLWFGIESQFTHFLEQYFSVTIVEKLLIERGTAQMFNVPGKAVMLNAYNDKTDIIFGFFSPSEIAYDHRDEAGQRRLIREQFEGVGWRVPELLREVAASRSFYFDKLCQIRMPVWARGRVALVGDAGYCPSPAAGLGGSLAIDGAAALTDALRQHPDDHVRAFQVYERELRPFIEEIQAEAVRVGLEALVPRTEAAIRERNAKLGGGF
jgi:2-polyprenyl-6-methoxyphenol hydroxylase-like FAD-dependent oxidoreductase